MADEIIRLDYSAEDIGANIDEVREARGEYDSLDERLDEIEGGGFTPTQAQLDAMNSGITDDDVEQIDLNKNNILSMSWTVEEYNYTTTEPSVYEYTGVSVTCPAGKIMEIYAVDRRGLATPLAIAICDDNESITASESLVAENNADISQGLSIWSRQVMCITPAIRTIDKKYYIWVKRASAANNNILLAYRLIN